MPRSHNTSRQTAAQRPNEVLKSALGARTGYSVGDFELLAGIDTCNDAERQELWRRFRHLFVGDVQTLFDAVCDHCASIALARVNAGELCLLQQGR